MYVHKPLHSCIRMQLYVNTCREPKNVARTNVCMYVCVDSCALIESIMC